MPLGNEKAPVLVVGSLNIDLVVSVERFPAPGETISGQHFAVYPGGKGANQAVAAGRLGAKVYMVGCVGRDEHAGMLFRSLADNRVDAAYVRQVADATGVALIAVDSAGSNTIIVVPGANACCAAPDVDKALAGIGKPGVLLVQHEIPPATVDHAVRAAKGRGWKVILNPAPARRLSPATLELIDIIVPNESEASNLAGMPVHTVEDAAIAAQKILHQGAQTVIITLGDKGAIGCSETGEWHIPACRVAAVDTTAAGDAYIGALATGLTEGCSLEECMRFAGVAASIAVTRPGAQPSLPWRGELPDQNPARQGI